VRWRNACDRKPVPQITDVSVDGTTNTPDPSPNSPDGEVALDIQVAAAAYFVATGVPATIRVYWAQDIATAVRQATTDGCDVCSISWGADEAVWGASAGQDMEQAAIDATNAGMIVFAASGDNDSSDGGPTVTARRLKRLEAENARLRKTLAELTEK
jgi:kumamolisin